MNRICRKSANENTIMHAIGALSTGILFKELKMEKQRELSHDNYSLDPNVFFLLPSMILDLKDLCKSLLCLYCVFILQPSCFWTANKRCLNNNINVTS